MTTTNHPHYHPSRSLLLGYSEPYPINLKNVRRPRHAPRHAFDEAPALSAAAGPDFYDRLGKLLRIVRKRLSDEEWVELGQILGDGGAPAEDDSSGTEHIKAAGGDPLKLVAPRSLGPDGKIKFRGVAQDHLASRRTKEDDESFNRLFPDAAKIKQEPGYGADTAKDNGANNPSRKQSETDQESFDKLFPDSKRLK